MINLIAINTSDDNISTSNLHIFDMIDLLVKKYNYKIIDINLLYQENINQYLEKTYNKLPDNIFIIKGSSGICDFKTDTKINISFFIDDVHPGGVVRKKRTKSLTRVTHIFNTYAYAFNKYYPKRNYILHWFPHSTRFTDISFNDDPIPKIIITGRLNKDIYPNRQYIYDLSKKDKRIEYLKPNIGYRIKKKDFNDKMIFGKKFVLYINRYLCGFTCDLIEERSYLVAKHFEIMSSGALLLACNINTKKYFKKLGYYDLEHYVSCTPDNMLEKINFILNPENRELIDTIRKNGYSHTIKNHNYKIRTNFLHNVLTYSTKIVPLLQVKDKLLLNLNNEPIKNFEFKGDIIIVGSSGKLTRYENGKIIDKYENIIRFNIAPTTNYEKYVGSKTSIRLIRGNSIRKIIKSKSYHFLNEADITIFISSDIESIKIHLDHNKKHYIINQKYFDLFNNLFNGKATTGIYGFLLCYLFKDSISKTDLIGFMNLGDIKGKYWFHYWEKLNGRQFHFLGKNVKAHSFFDESHMIKKLINGKILY